MNDLDPALGAQLDLEYPLTLRAPDWADVLARASVRPRHRWRMVALVAAVVIGVTVPTFALSASVRDLFGFKPVYSKAELLVSTPVGDGRVVRVWRAPNAGGGECILTTVDRPDAGLHGSDGGPPDNGGGGCSTGPIPARLPTHFMLNLGVSMAHNSDRPGGTPPIVQGYINPMTQASRIELVWRAGRQRLAFANNYFVGVAPVLFKPSFDLLPFYTVAYDKQGREVAREKVITGGLYLGYRKILPELRAYVRAHPGRHIM